MTDDTFRFRKTLSVIFLAEVRAANMERAQEQLVGTDDIWVPQSSDETIVYLDKQESEVFKQTRTQSDELPILAAWERLLPWLSEDAGVFAGSLYTPADNRLLLLALAMTIHTHDILELGYDAGLTTMVLALSGANVVGVDNQSEHPLTDLTAKARLQAFDNVTLHNTDALDYLRQCPDHSFDFVFVDDNHAHDHVREECKELPRILRPGGMAVFHDTVVHNLWPIVLQSFPRHYQFLELPSLQADGSDFGIGIAYSSRPVHQRVDRPMPDANNPFLPDANNPFYDV